MNKGRDYNERYMKLCKAGKEIVDRAFVQAELAERQYKKCVRRVRKNAVEMVPNRRPVIIENQVTESWSDGKGGVL